MKLQRVRCIDQQFWVLICYVKRNNNHSKVIRAGHNVINLFEAGIYRAHYCHYCLDKHYCLVRERSLPL